MLSSLFKDRESGRLTSNADSSYRGVRSLSNLPIAGFIGLLGLFIATAGLGSGNGVVSATGLGLVISAVVYALHTITQRRLAQMVSGTAHVVSASEPPNGATHGRCDMHLVVQAPRLSATAVRHRAPSVPVAKWPVPGRTIPVLVNPRDPRDVKIRWEKVPAHHAVASRRSADAPETPPVVETIPPRKDGLADLADAATGTTRDPNVGPILTSPTESDVSSNRAPVLGTDGSRQHTDRLSDILDASQGDPVDLSYLDESDLDALLDSDPLLAEYGSPIRDIGVTVIVSDLKQSLTFYRDVLGFFEIESGPDMVLLEARTGRLVLQQREGTAVRSPRLMHLTLEVNDIDAAYQTLSNRGVHFLHPPQPVLTGEMLQLWAASFQDPDGHGVALTCWQPRAEDSPADS